MLRVSFMIILKTYNESLIRMMKSFNNIFKHFSKSATFFYVKPYKLLCLLGKLFLGGCILLR